MIGKAIVMLSSIGQLLTWIVVVGALLPLELEAHRGYEVNRRYGPPATKVKPAGSQTSVQTWQQHQLQYDRSVARERDRQTPRYLDIGLHSLQQLDSDLLFPDPALFNAETKAASYQQQQVANRPMHPYYQYSQHNKYNDELTALLEPASNINYPVRYNRPYKLKPATWNYLQYDQNVGATAESGPTSVSCCSGNGAWTPIHYMSTHLTANTHKTRVNEREPSKVSLFLPMANPEYAAVVHADESQLVTQTMPSLMIEEEITTADAALPSETLLIPVPRENATAIVAADVPQLMNGTDIVTTLPASNDQPLVISVTSSPASESPIPIASLSPSQPTVNQPTVNQPTVNQPTVNQPTVNQPTVNQPTVNQPTVNQPTVNQPTVNQPTVNQPTVNQPTVQPAAQSSSPTQPPVNQPAVKKPVASTAKPVRNQTPVATTEKAQPPSPPPPQRPQQQKQPAEPKPSASKPASDSPPPSGPVNAPPQADPLPVPQPPAQAPQIAPPAIDPAFTAPSGPALANVPEVVDVEPSGVPGDLPLFEQGGGIVQDVGAVASPAEAAGGGGEESPFPGLFSEFLNQVADMIEEFQPTTELPLADEPFGGEVNDPVQGASNLDGGASNFGQESVMSGDTVGGFPNDVGGVGGGQDGGDLGGGVGDFPGNDFGGDTAGSELQGGSSVENAGGDPQANNPVPQSVPNDPSASVGGTQSAPSNSVGQQAAPASTNSASPPPAKPAAAEAAAQSSSPTAEQAEFPPIPSAQYSSPEEYGHHEEGAAPNYANDYAIPGIVSEPQAYPPMINDYLDPAMIPYDSLPNIGASLGSNGEYTQSRPSEGGAAGEGEFHHREQAFNGGANHNGGETAQVAAQSEGNYQQEQYEGGAATTAASAYDTSGGVTPQYPAQVDIYNPGSAGSVYEPIPVPSNYEEGGLGVAINGTTYEYGDEYAANDTTLTEEQPLVPVANHLEVHVSQSVWTSSTSEPPPPPSTTSSAEYPTSTTFVPSSVTYAQNEGLSSSSSSSGSSPAASSTEPSSYVHSADAPPTPAGKAMNDRRHPPEVYRKESSNSEQHMEEKMTSNSESDTSTVREYVPPRFLVPHSSNHVDDYAEDPEPETVSSVSYPAEGSPPNGAVVEDEAADAEGIPSELLPEVEANISLDLKKTPGFSERKDDGNNSTPSS